MIAAAILTFVLGVIGYFAPDISAILGTQAILLQTAIPIIIITFVGIIILRFISVRKKFRKESVVIVVTRKPKHISKQILLERFGVKWKALVGSLLRGDFVNGDYYVHIEGPFCPQCGFKLISRNESKWKGLSYKQVWHCAQCPNNYERPKQYLYEEDDIVKELVEANLQI